MKKTPMIFRFAKSVAVPAAALPVAILGSILFSGSFASAQETKEAPPVAEVEAKGEPQVEASQQQVIKGVVTEQPAEGHFVKTEHGFMVPYTETIPGTDITFQMVPVPAGTFLMGSPDSEEDRNADEGPQVSIAVEPFWIGKHEVTWSEYKVYMDLHDQFKAFDRKGIRSVTEENEIDAVTAPSSLYEPSFTYDAGDDPETPAATMTQYSAKQYTKWLSILNEDFYRLPAEAEWEYACRAGTTTAFNFGDDESELEANAWFDDNADYERHEVGSKGPNAWGLHDMHGNVAEWVLDQYEEDRYKKLKEMAKGDAPVSVADSICWPDSDRCVVRGGSWELYSYELRSASRLAADYKEWKSDDPNIPRSPWWCTTEPATGVGFRIVRPLVAPATRDAKEEFWKSRWTKEIAAIKFRLESDGKGAKGIVDTKLPEAIEGLRKKKRKK